MKIADQPVIKQLSTQQLVRPLKCFLSLRACGWWGHNPFFIYIFSLWHSFPPNPPLHPFNMGIIGTKLGFCWTELYLRSRSCGIVEGRGGFTDKVRWDQFTTKLISTSYILCNCYWFCPTWAQSLSDWRKICLCSVCATVQYIHTTPTFDCVKYPILYT